MKRILFTILATSIFLFGAKNKEEAEVLPDVINTYGFTYIPFQATGITDAILTDGTTSKELTLSDLNTNTDFGYLRGIEFKGGSQGINTSFTAATDNFSQSLFWLGGSYAMPIINTSFLKFFIEPSVGMGVYTTSYDLYADLYDAGSHHTIQLQDIELTEDHDIIASSYGWGWSIAGKAVINFTKYFGIFAEYGYQEKYFQTPSIKSYEASDDEDNGAIFGIGDDINDENALYDGTEASPGSVTNPFTNASIKSAGAYVTFGIVIVIPQISEVSKDMDKMFK